MLDLMGFATFVLLGALLGRRARAEREGWWYLSGLALPPIGAAVLWLAR
jgi:hypothetical protein